MIDKPNFHVLTGGPGVGKTTLLRHLARLGELTVGENARAVIREEAKTGGQGLPWLDNERFVALTSARDVADFDARTDETRRVFFDRGLMDMVGCNGAVPSGALLEAVRTRRYNPTVFVFPPWREIYATDAERRQDWDEAERTFERVCTQLPTLGYEPLVVPIGTVEERAAFVLARAVSGS
jgi:predicted ATPase